MIHVGDCLSILPTLDAESVQTCITSPPYFGLRDYGVAGQLGLESSPAEFVDAMVRVFREVRRVLRDDGTLWLNLGDSYAGSWGAQGRPQGDGQMKGRSVASARQIGAHPRFDRLTGTRGRDEGYKPKDLFGIPWRVAFALQADGWYLRQDIIWHKPNPMPESVTDRCTKAHEYLFLLTKSPRYYFDAEAIAEPIAPASIARLSQPNLSQQTGSERVPGKTNGNMKAVGDSETRNKRSVWTVPTMPFREAHFATFPEALIRPCIEAGSRPGDLVLDPFMGAGTTAVVCERLARRWVGCELNGSYAEIAHKRIRDVQPGLPLGATA